MTSVAERLPGDPIWLELTSTDAERSLAFYGGLFGWATEPGSTSLDGSVTLRLGRDRIARLVPMPEDGWLVYLAVLDAGAAATAAEAHGGSVQLGPSPVGDLGIMAIATDPSGARVGFWQPGTHPGFEVEDVPGAPTWFELHTEDFAAAVPFYRDVVGWRPVSMGDSDEFRMVVNGEPGAAQAGIYDGARDDLDDESAWMPYFAVEDADAAAARVRELGGALLDHPVDTPFGRMVHASDPLGTLFTLIRLPETRSAERT
ncbi:VOC family protein [Pseudolysinimonas sp.]|jgi:predicted enzyme related to lactoylglutathione lyase|uniref:VOC family protein n=1 Tax=Pseudolysinimonas sp. TaxID=2680009 RepID=UPI003783FA9E